MGVHLSGKTAVLEEFIRQHARQEEASSSCAASSGGRDAVALPRLRHARPAQPAVLSPTVPFYGLFQDLSDARFRLYQRRFLRLSIFAAFSALLCDL